ncbi:MAG: ABC transporter permease [Alphaproteobacteria bacterium]|nr:ABC transporter permease [Alphaproteobacteria bacterium]
MSAFLVRRLLTLAATLLAASLVIFVVVEVLPGDPARTILGPEADPEAVAALRVRLGLERPPAARYLAWVGGLLGGEFGVSYTYHVPIGGLLAERLAITLPLAAVAMALTTAIALSAGVYAAARRGSAGDVAVMALTQLGIAVPGFWFAILLILLFAVELGWFPAGGFAGWDAGIGAALRSLVLPAIALALVQAAILARVTRSAVIEVLDEDFMRTARAKGLSRRAALWRHGLRNALVAVVTVMGLQFANLTAGAVVLENVFALPGLGRLAFQAISQRDLQLVRDVVLLFAVVVVAVNFLVDLLYAVIDPRVKLSA